jgi:hypothetical protein
MPPFNPHATCRRYESPREGVTSRPFENEPFHFLGFNDAISWVGLNGLFARRDYAAAEQYLAHLAENGVTVLRLMLEYTHRESRYFEKPVGRFVPAMVRLWDDLSRYARPMAFAFCSHRSTRSGWRDVGNGIRTTGRTAVPPKPRKAS